MLAWTAPAAAKAAIAAWRCGAPSKMYGPVSGAAVTMGDVFGLTCLRYRCNSRAASISKSAAFSPVTIAAPLKSISPFSPPTAGMAARQRCLAPLEMTP